MQTLLISDALLNFTNFLAFEYEMNSTERTLKSPGSPPTETRRDTDELHKDSLCDFIIKGPSELMA